MLTTHELDYPLPDELIATTPASPRDAARLMVVDRDHPSPERVRHALFRDLGAFLCTGDLLILNTTAVLPARFVGVREDTGGHAEGLFVGEGLRAVGQTPPSWHVLVKMKRANPGVRIALTHADGAHSGVYLRLLDRHPDEGWLATPEGVDPALTAREVLDRVGYTPVPPYIAAARKKREIAVPDAFDRAEYQTVFAQSDSVRSEGRTHASIAAPTAGLHFTPELLESLRVQGVHTAEVVLDVGLGTFKHIETQFVEQHPMHAEFCCIPPQTIEAIRDCKARGGRVVAVGSTAARTLETFESFGDMSSRAPAGVHTRLLITPGRPWRCVDALITNFHLPRTTLLAMVAAMLGDDHAAATRLRVLYDLAVRERYRFFSFGDAMLIHQPRV